MFKLMIPFKLCFTMDRVLRLATSPKCRARLGYLFVLGLYFGINPTPAPPPTLGLYLILHLDTKVSIF
jgi:cytochrome c biogenesis protein CcdA